MLEIAEDASASLRMNDRRIVTVSPCPGYSILRPRFVHVADFASWIRVGFEEEIAGRCEYQKGDGNARRSPVGP
jgi:hypothetical protein